MSSLRGRTPNWFLDARALLATHRPRIRLVQGHNKSGSMVSLRQSCVAHAEPRDTQLSAAVDDSDICKGSPDQPDPSRKNVSRSECRCCLTPLRPLVQAPPLPHGAMLLPAAPAPPGCDGSGMEICISAACSRTKRRSSRNRMRSVRSRGRGGTDAATAARPQGIFTTNFRESCSALPSTSQHPALLNPTPVAWNVQG